MRPITQALHSLLESVLVSPCRIRSCFTLLPH